MSNETPTIKATRRRPPPSFNGYGTMTAPTPPKIPYTRMIQAIMAEGDELSQRLAAIGAFMQSDGFKALDAMDRHLLTMQAKQMDAYLHTLRIRMQRFEEKRGIVPGATGLIKPN